MKTIIYLNALFLLFFTVVFSQNDNNLLKRIQDKYDSINSLSADFTQNANGGQKISGKIIYKKDNNLKVDTKASTIVTNGSTNWNYNKKQNKVIISDYNDADASLFSFNKVVYDYPSKSDVKQTTESGNNILIITPKKDSGLNFYQAKIWVDNNNLINKIQIKEKNNSLMTIELSNYKLDQNLGNSQFTFTPPEGTKVIDLRQ